MRRGLEEFGDMNYPHRIRDNVVSEASERKFDTGFLGRGFWHN
jgi:hypothetical protein